MGLRVLIIEDDPETQRVLEMVFTRDPAFLRHQVQVFKAADGQAGIDLYEKEDPDVVITDLMLPNVDGVQVVKRIRATERGRSVPLIVTSAVYRDRSFINRLSNEYRIEFFPKPFPVREVCRKILELVGRFRADSIGPKKLKKPPVATGSVMATPRSLPRTGAVPEAGANRRGAAPVAPTTGRVVTRARVPVAPGGRPQIKSTQPQFPAAPPPARTGNLGDYAVARLLFDFHEEGATGSLRLRRGQLKRVIYLLGGEAIFADSNVRSETLGHVLVARGILTREQEAQALSLAESQRIHLGEAIVQLGWATAEEAFDHLTTQVRLKLANALRWRQGTFEFEVGNSFSGKVARCDIDLPRLIFSVLRKLPTQGTPRGTLRATERFERYRKQLSPTFHDALISRLQGGPVDATTVLEELPFPGIPGELRTLYETGLADLQYAPELFDKAEEPTLKRLARDTRSLTPVRDPIQNPVLYNELFGPTREVAAAPDTLESVGDFETTLQQFSPKERAAKRLILGAYLAAIGKRPRELLGVNLKSTREEVDRVYAERRERFRPGKFKGLNLGGERSKLEELNGLIEESYQAIVNQQALLDEPHSPGPRTNAQRAMKAEIVFRQGEEHLKKKRPAQAIEFFEGAIKLSPEHSDYHAYLGWSHFRAQGGGSVGANAAAAHIDVSLSMNPDLAIGREFAARIALETGATSAAIAHLERLLETQPDHPGLLELLDEACRKQGTPREMERIYRKAIDLFGDTNPTRSTELMLRLADLYRSLGEPRSARVAFEAVAHHTPDDDHVVAALKELASSDESRGPRAPLTHEELSSAFRKHHKQGNPDAAFHHAAVLVFRRADDEEANVFYQRHRPRFLLRASSPLHAGLIDQLRHGADDPNVDVLLATLAEKIQQGEPVELGPRVLRVTSVPSSFASVLAYVTAMLEVASPRVYQALGTEGSVELRDAQELSLIVSPDVMNSDDKIALGFWLGRELYRARPGCVVTAGRGPAMLKPYFGQHRVNLDEWYTGVRRSAERIGLLLCGDYSVAARTMDTSEAVRSGLQRFALSARFVELRRQLGISLVV